MRLKSFRIRNFRSIKDIHLEMPYSGIMILTGENSVGKTNIIKALYNILGKNWWGKNLNITDYYGYSPDNKINISLEFDNGYSVEFDDNGHWARYLDADKKEIYPSKALVKDDFPAVLLESDRNFKQFFSLHRWTTFGKIGTIINKNLFLTSQFKHIIEKVSELEKLLFEATSLGDFDVMLSKIFNRISLDESQIGFTLLSPFELLSNISVIKTLDDVGSDFDRMSSSEKNLIAISVLISYMHLFLNSRSGLIILDNPELYLTPSNQIQLYNFLREYSKESDYQFIISTSSPYFIDFTHIEEIVRVYKIENSTKVKQLSKKALAKLFSVDGDAIIRSLRLSYKYDIGSALMSNKVVLVSDKVILKVIKSLFSLYDKELLKDIAIINVEGKKEVVLYSKILSSFGLDIIGVIENFSDRQQRGNEVFYKEWTINVVDIEEFSEDYKIFRINKKQSLFVINSDINVLLMKEINRVAKEYNLSISLKALKEEFGSLLVDEVNFGYHTMVSVFDTDTDFLYDLFRDLKHCLE